MTSNSRLLVAGAINTDLVAIMERAPRAGETITADGFQTFGGGKGANQAVAAARNGVPTVMLGACGEDDYGRARRADLEAIGVDTAWIRVDHAHASGVALIFVEREGENRIAYVPGATLHVPPEHCLECFATIQPAMVLATNELSQASLTTLFMAASGAGVPVVFNATPDPESCGDLLPLVDTLIVNEGEAQALIGEQVEPGIASLRALLQRGPRTVVCTLGARGAVAVTADTEFGVIPPEVDVVDTTGAGDAFCGAYAAALIRTGDRELALRYGVHSGALSATVAGAQSSSPIRAAVEQSMGV